MGSAALMFKDNFSLEESERYLLWLLIGLLIVVFILRVVAGNQKLQAIMELQVVRHMKGLFRKGDSQVVALLPRMLGVIGQPKYGSGPELAIAGTMAGLMNTQGGYLFIGVDKDGNCTGLEADYKVLGKPSREGFHQHLLQVVGTILDPSCCMLLKVSFHIFDGKDVCRIRVKRAFSPVYVHMGERSYFYVREGLCTRELEVREALEYIERTMK